MPELPEVETVRQDLLKYILNKKITGIEIKLPRLLRGDGIDFRNGVEGRKIVDIERIGKLLMLILDSSDIILVHLKMTGQLIYQDDKNLMAGGHSQSDADLLLPNQHTYIILKFQGGGSLYFNDMRTFGYWKLIKADEKAAIIAKYGMEPVRDNWTWENWEKIIKKHPQAKLKSFLLNQSYISGLGNIYVDEAAFCAGILPDRKVGTLSETEKKKLFECIPAIINEALGYKGTTFRDYRNGDGKKGNYTNILKVFRRQGELCSRCGKAEIQKIKLAGRGTHFCPHCQK